MEWAHELYVHAIAVEAEAARRYAELARRMAGLGEEAAAALFAELAAADARHTEALRRRTQRVHLPDLTCDHSWADASAASPRQALSIALKAERDARAFFQHARRIAQEPAALALAEEMALEESEHIARIERLCRP